VPKHVGFYGWFPRKEASALKAYDPTTSFGLTETNGVKEEFLLKERLRRWSRNKREEIFARQRQKLGNFPVKKNPTDGGGGGNRITIISMQGGGVFRKEGSSRAREG